MAVVRAEVDWVLMGATVCGWFGLLRLREGIGCAARVGAEMGIDDNNWQPRRRGRREVSTVVAKVHGLSWVLPGLDGDDTTTGRAGVNGGFVIVGLLELLFAG
ncbi:hypothetical protein M0R45_002264 [Rubus argutus]|uniref:Uncharacterized protein n=1 Tax=Rubus argutus TaxID=59490 RepID=A0AAW1VCD0_RUBAR